MTIPQYKYIKGCEVLSDEHMLSATEIAKLYGLLTVNGKPNGLLACHILSDYVYKTNLNIAEYYYPHSHGVMRVYPSALYDKALTEFIFPLEENQVYTYTTRDQGKGRRKINYRYKQVQKVYSITEMKEKKNHGRNEGMSTLR